MGLLGAHMSIAGGLPLAIDRGDALGCEAIQIFLSSSRTWKIAPLAEETIAEFRARAKAAKKVRRIVAHNSYLLNLSTADETTRKKSVAYFIELMHQCEALGVESMITHPGSHLGAGEDVGIAQTSKSLDEVLAACRGFRARVLLENTAGQGDCVGHRFEQLAAMVAGTKRPEAVGFCFDTEHAFAAGYDLRDEESYEATFAAWNRHLGVARIEAFHVNDAVKPLGCRVDRHESIGRGHLGKEAFRLLVNDRRFAAVPMCLETAPGDEMKNWKRELKLLRSLAVTSSPLRAKPSAARARAR